MGSRERRVDIGAARGRAMTADVLGEIRAARLDRAIGSQDVARAVGLSPAQYSRIERGQTPCVSVLQLSTIASAVGLDLAVRCFPAGQPLRDAAHAALLERMRVRLHPSLRFATEVLLPTPADRRAWDAVIIGPDWRLGIEAETRPRDRQALERRLALKERDGDVTGIVLLLLDSRHNREFVRAHREAMAERFPIGSRRALELLRDGAYPGGNAIILL